MRPIFVNTEELGKKPRYINLNCIAKIHENYSDKCAEFIYWGEVGTFRTGRSDCSFDEFMERVQDALETSK